MAGRHATASTPSVTVGPWEIVNRTERIPIYSNSPSPDAEWRFVDAAGHGHFWKGGYPTLKAVEEPCYCSAVDEDHTVSHWECPHCGETIEPGTVPASPFPTYIQGPISLDLIYDDGDERREYSIRSEKDAQAILNDPVSAIPRITEATQPDRWERRGGIR